MYIFIYIMVRLGKNGNYVHWRLCRIREELNMKMYGVCTAYDKEFYIILNRSV
jgi:hypothetical protein